MKVCHMRRKEKEIKDRSEIEKIIARADTAKIGLCDNDQPYIVPVNFGFENNSLYFHCAPEGRKIDIIRKNNNVCFEIDIDHEMTVSDTACEWNFKYKSVIGFGKAVIIDDLDGKKKALDIIMGHYSDKAFSYRDDRVDGILIVRIEIESMTGKQAGYPQ